MGNRGSETCRLIPFVSLTIFFFCFSANSALVDYISRNQSLRGNQTVVSKSGIFELGFFKPGNTEKYYIGIWYRKVSIQPVVWVANRDEPIEDPSKSELKIYHYGLVLLNYSDEVWTAYISINADPTLAVLLDTGNFVLRSESVSSPILWQSFDYPTDMWLPGAKLTLDEYDQQTQLVTSWRSLSDPAPGDFSFKISRNSNMQNPDKQVYTFDILWIPYEMAPWGRSHSEHVFRTGVYDCQIFLESVAGIEMKTNENSTYFTLSSSLSGLGIDYWGAINKLTWSEHKGNWSSSPAMELNHRCGPHYQVGPGTIYNTQKPPHCTCLPGFRPRSSPDWSMDNWSGGCVRIIPFQCHSLGSGEDDFSEIPLTTLPQYARVGFSGGSVEQWKFACLVTCACTAFAYYRGKYYFWYTDLWNLQQTMDEELVNGYIYLRLQFPKNLRLQNGKTERNIGPTVGAVLGVLFLLVIVLLFVWRYRRRHLIAASMIGEGSLVVYKYWVLQKVTKNFSKKLGRGSFGSVFKGEWPNSTAIAVKRLEGITQGDKQFRSEVSTIGIIHHVNLLRLWGFCSEGTKKLLVYEYMKYGSLENHLFHQKGSAILDWKTRFQVAIGTARGLAYLHEECRERIIHCDIKPENILLDANFQPKVADFGMAKLLGREFSRVLTTMRGTIGYLAPEWISGSPITPKADVYSYGMMLLEIISGRRNTSKFEGDNVHYFPVWAAAKLNEGEVLSLLDQRLNGNADLEELTRACRVACWCIQDDEADRPSMGKVVQILEGVVEVNIPPISRRLLNLVEAQEEDTVAVLDSRSDQSTQLHTEYGSCEN